MVKNDFQYGGWNSYTLQCAQNCEVKHNKPVVLALLGIYSAVYRNSELFINDLLNSN